ncbi:MAG: hypothetical protein ACK55Z_11945, partial [bacterium]
ALDFWWYNHSLTVRTLFFKPVKIKSMSGGHISSIVLLEFLLELEYTMYFMAVCMLSPPYVSVGF